MNLYLLKRLKYKKGCIQGAVVAAPGPETARNLVQGADRGDEAWISERETSCTYVGSASNRTWLDRPLVPSQGVVLLTYERKGLR